MTKRFDEKRYFTELRRISAAVPYEEADYFNSCFASAYALGREDELTETKIMKMMLTAVEEGFLEYSKAITLNEMYKELFVK